MKASSSKTKQVLFSPSSLLPSFPPVLWFFFFFVPFSSSSQISTFFVSLSNFFNSSKQQPKILLQLGQVPHYRISTAEIPSLHGRYIKFITIPVDNPIQHLPLVPKHSSSINATYSPSSWPGDSKQMSGFSKPPGVDSSGKTNFGQPLNPTLPLWGTCPRTEKRPSL